MNAHTDHAESTVCNVVGYGARAGGTTVNTKAIQAAIDACGAPATPFTGAHVEEVTTPGPTRPEWRSN